MDILSLFLKKQGVTDPSNLDGEERKVFEQYKSILGKEVLTVEDIKKYLVSQVAVIEAKWRDYDYERKAELIPYHTIYSTLLETIDAPKREREVLEQYLSAQINR